MDLFYIQLFLFFGMEIRNGGQEIIFSYIDKTVFGFTYHQDIFVSMLLGEQPSITYSSTSWTIFADVILYVEHILYRSCR
jgi:hypothetical protein